MQVQLNNLNGSKLAAEVPDERAFSDFVAVLGDQGAVTVYQRIHGPTEGVYDQVLGRTVLGQVVGQIEKIRADVKLPPELLRLIDNINKLLEQAPPDQGTTLYAAMLALMAAATGYFERSAAE